MKKKTQIVLENRLSEFGSEKLMEISIFFHEMDLVIDTDAVSIENLWYAITAVIEGRK